MELEEGRKSKLQQENGGQGECSGESDEVPNPHLQFVHFLSNFPNNLGSRSTEPLFIGTRVTPWVF